MTECRSDGPPTEEVPIEEIADEDWLYRRLALNHFRSDGTVNRTAFMRNSTPPKKGKEPDPEVSVDLARLTTPPNSAVGSLAAAGRPNQGIATLQANFPRGLDLEVVHAPVMEPPNLRNVAQA